MMNPQPVLDCRGIQITEGCTVVASGASGCLYEKQVKAVQHLDSPSWWVNIRFTDGSYTTPDRVVVIKV